MLSADGDSVWLYLSTPRAPFPERDCWLLNFPSAPPTPNLELYRSTHTPPPAPAKLIDPAGVRSVSLSEPWRFTWSRDGNAVAALLADMPIGFIVLDFPRGFSKYLRESGDWGNVWDQSLFDRVISSAA